MRLILKHVLKDISSCSEHIIPINYESKEKVELDLKEEVYSWLKDNHKLFQDYYVNLKKLDETYLTSNDDMLNQTIENMDNIYEKINNKYYLGNKNINLFFLITDYNIITTIKNNTSNDSEVLIEELFKLYSPPTILTVDEFFADVD